MHVLSMFYLPGASFGSGLAVEPFKSAPTFACRPRLSPRLIRHESLDFPSPLGHLLCLC